MNDHYPDSDYESSRNTSHLRKSVVFRSTLAIVIVAAGIALALQVGGGGEVEAAVGDEAVDLSPYFECDAPQPRPAPEAFTDEMRRERERFLEAVLDFELETGWSRVSSAHVETGAHTCGWSPAIGASYDDIAAASRAAAATGGLPTTPVYDDIDGELIGHLYVNAFIPVEISSDPDVDLDDLVGR